VGVLPADPIVRITIVKHGWGDYQLVGYTVGDDWGGWDYEGSYFTRRGAEHAARRVLRREQTPVVAEVSR
jgi:hypothetical protein